MNKISNHDKIVEMRLERAKLRLVKLEGESHTNTVLEDYRLKEIKSLRLLINKEEK